MLFNLIDSIADIAAALLVEGGKSSSSSDQNSSVEVPDYPIEEFTPGTTTQEPTHWMNPAPPTYRFNPNENGPNPND